MPATQIGDGDMPPLPTTGLADTEIFYSFEIRFVCVICGQDHEFRHATSIT